MTKHKATDLVRDFDIYPRGSVDSTHVTALADRIEAGVELPPVVVEKGTLRIVDGFHRVAAHQRVYGDRAVVECVEETFDSEGALYLRAIELNATHGRPLNRMDMKKIIDRSNELSIDDDLVRGALRLTFDKYAELTAERIAHVVTPVKPGAKAPKKPAPVVRLKKTVAHLNGQDITPAQAEVNAKLSGASQTYLADQLIGLTSTGMVNFDNPRTVKRLIELRDHLIALDLEAHISATV